LTRDGITIMKKSFYIFCFVVLGVILQQIVHTVLEIWYIKLLINNFNKYGFGLSWDSWFLIHHIYTGVFLAIGILSGYLSGKYWWPKLYDLNGKVRYPKPWRI